MPRPNPASSITNPPRSFTHYLSPLSSLLLPVLTTLFVLTLPTPALSLTPTAQPLLYPNTESSPSLYLLSFLTEKDLVTGEYMLVNMEWVSTDINPYYCGFVNVSISVRCSNLNTSSFTLSFSTVPLLAMNPQLNTKKTIVLELLSDLPSGVGYTLEIGLKNNVENIKKISQSIQIYTISSDGLIHQQNLNFGPVAHRPPITSILPVSIYTSPNDLSASIPGTLTSLKLQLQISIPISTPKSSLFFILQQPFRFSSSSYLTVYDAEQYSTNPIPLNQKPNISFFEVRTPHLFYAAFDQKFVVGRKFIVLITQIRIPFYIASSNVSVYSGDFNSLTPLEGYERLISLRAVTQQLNLNLGLPYDMPMVGPCVFYRNRQNYYQIKFYMPLDVPQGYAIKVLASQNTIIDGTGYVDFQSLSYTTMYDYFTSTNYFIMRKMGPILQGSLITIIFKASKNAITNFYIDVFIDTEAIIAAATATSYMFYGRVNSQSVDADDFYQYFRSSSNWQYDRADTALSGSQYTLFYFYPYVPTSTGAYIQMFFSPYVSFASNFNANTDCRINNVANSGICTVVRTANYIQITLKASPTYQLTYPNIFPQYSYQYIYFYNIRFPRPSSPKYPYMIYTRLFNSSAANPTTYIESQSFSVLPPTNTLSSSITLTEQGNFNSSIGLRYPAFIRFACTNPSVMAYTLQENEERVVSILSTYGFRDLLTLNNQDEYPCVSGTGTGVNVRCVYNKGILANGDWWQMERFSELERIDIFFKTGSTETTTNFQIIVPDSINMVSGGGQYYYFYLMGIYNKLTKDYKYLYRNSGFYRYYNWINSGTNIDSSNSINFQGKAGSYRSNVSLTVSSSSMSVNYQNYIVISSSWLLFQKGISSYSVGTSASTNPQFYSGQLAPQSLLMGSGMYLTVLPFKITSSMTTFTIYLDNLHLPYHYDLPNYYIFVISGTYNDVVAYNQFQMTNQGIFYQAYLASLTFDCQENFLGVQNTICTIVFGTQSPLKADGKIVFSFSGLNVATSTCSLVLPNGTLTKSTCSSTSDNKNVTLSLTDIYNAYHYPANNFTAKISGLSIISTQISQSVSVYLYDPTGNYVIEHGNRILTTTVSRPSSIQIYQILYKYLTPLAANKMTVRFYLPRGLYSDEKLGFVMGKDLSDVNLEANRMRIVLTRSDNAVIQSTYQLITNQYKVLFSFRDSTQLTPTNYTLQIFGIFTPASFQNGAFSIIYQRTSDKAYTLTNAIKTTFPSLPARIISSISLSCSFNTESFPQLLSFTLTNTADPVTQSMVWLINLPSYYSPNIFNSNPYCLIDSTPISCSLDPQTPYQIIVTGSPKRVEKGVQYGISVWGVAAPRGKYMNDYYRGYYVFMGVLVGQGDSVFVQTALLYPEQVVQSTIGGIVSVRDITVNALTMPTFSSIYATFNFLSNVAIPTGSYLYLIFPQSFDNFNNQPISLILKIANVIKFTYNAPVIDRTIQILFSSSIPISTQFVIEFPSLPTPKFPCSVEMSQIIAYFTPANKKSIFCASSLASNSAPILTFVQDSRYLEFNGNQEIRITAGTYSDWIQIKSSDNARFLTNINVNLTGSGFTFEPPTVFLKLGDQKGLFRVGADPSLFPISYFYQTTKSQQMFTYYTITKNNNIFITSTPIPISIPLSIQVPIGGCSTPFLLSLSNAPLNDLIVSFNYNNFLYTESVFQPNSHLTKSQLLFTPTIIKNYVSFCVASGFSSLSLPNQFILKFQLAGSNYRSYQFLNDGNVTIDITPSAPSVIVPSLTIQLINRQKSFFDFNLTTSLPGIVYYSLQLGQNQPAMDLTSMQVYIKNNQFVLESNADFMNRMYTTDRDKRVGVEVRTSGGMFTLRMPQLLPERYYTFCGYFETFYNVVTAPTCLTVQTQIWGQIVKAKVSFSSPLSDQNLNNVLCFFTKSISTQLIYAVDLQGNSCHDHKVHNLYYSYPGTTVKSESSSTIIYIMTNPTLTSDPSPNAFRNMYTSSSDLSASSLSQALSGFAINFLSSKLLSTSDAISQTYPSNAYSISVTFSQPVYSQQSSTIQIPNVFLSSPGTVYFCLILYKKIHFSQNSSYVQIRLNSDPSPEQVINCQNYESLAAEGCARAVYSYTPQNVRFDRIESNCMYKLYYVVASQYPLRPVLGEVSNTAIVTFLAEGFVKIGLAVCIWVVGVGFGV